MNHIVEAFAQGECGNDSPIFYPLRYCRFYCEFEELLLNLIGYMVTCAACIRIQTYGNIPKEWF